MTASARTTHKCRRMPVFIKVCTLRITVVGTLRLVNKKKKERRPDDCVAGVLLEAWYYWKGGGIMETVNYSLVIKHVHLGSLPSKPVPRSDLWRR